MNKSSLTLESLQLSLQHLAQRLEYAMEDDVLGDALDFDAVASILYGLADGQSGEDIANSLELPYDFPDYGDEDETTEEHEAH